MKNIFHQSFNVYKMDIEPRVNELTLHHIQCSHRLLEIMLSHRRVTVAFIEDDNVVVTVEGEAARVLNFDTGQFDYVKKLTYLVLQLYKKEVNREGGTSLFKTDKQTCVLYVLSGSSVTAGDQFHAPLQILKSAGGQVMVLQ